MAVSSGHCIAFNFQNNVHRIRHVASDMYPLCSNSTQNCGVANLIDSSKVNVLLRGGAGPVYETSEFVVIPPPMAGGGLRQTGINIACNVFPDPTFSMHIV